MPNIPRWMTVVKMKENKSNVINICSINWINKSKIITNMYCTIPFQLRQNIHWVYWLWLRIAVVLSVNCQCFFFSFNSYRHCIFNFLANKKRQNTIMAQIGRSFGFRFQHALFRLKIHFFCQNIVCVQVCVCVLCDKIMECNLSYPSFQFRWKSCLEFNWCTITIVSLYKNFHVCWIQCWCTWLRHDILLCCCFFKCSRISSF